MLSSKKICEIFLIYRKIFKKLNEEINIELKPYKITVQHAVYLMALKAKGHLTIKDLNLFVDNDKAITTRAIKTLKKQEFVEKIGSRIKKYKIAITSNGEKVFKVILNVINKFKKAQLKNITPQEILVLSNITDKLI